MQSTVYKIRKFRENKNYTQEYMASQLNISQSAYAQIESGITSINSQKLIKIAEILGVDLEKLVSTQELVLDIHNNTLNDNSAIIKELNSKQYELYERLLNDKDKLISIQQEKIVLMLKRILL